MAKHQLIVHEDPKSIMAEAYRTLRTNLQFAKIDSDLKTIMFTSSGPGEGKSTTAANTAIAIAQTGRKVVLMDCDLRKPVQHKIFGRQNTGVTNILAGDSELRDVLQGVDVANLELLTSGPVPPNPSELLGSAKMQTLITALTERSEIVVIDAPPVIAVTDASVLASKMDGIVLVVKAGTVRPEMARQAKGLLQKARGKILGVVLNQVEIEADHGYYYYYGEHH